MLKVKKKAKPEKNYFSRWYLHPLAGWSWKSHKLPWSTWCLSMRGLYWWTQWWENFRLKHYS